MSKTCITCGKEIEKYNLCYSCMNQRIAKKIPLLNIIPIEWINIEWLDKLYEIFRQYTEDE